MPFQNHIEQLLIAVLLVVVIRILWVRYQSHQEKQKKKSKKGPPRQWKARNPKKCPACRERVSLSPFHPNAKIIPWQQVKSPRGRKKTIDTQGHYCPNPMCLYYGIIDAAIHALVGNGKDGLNKHLVSEYV